MKRISKYFLRTMLIMGLIAFVLPIQAQVKFGVKAGVNANTIFMNYAEEDDEMSTQWLIGYHAGVLADIPLAGPFSIQPGLNYVSKGYRLDLAEIVPAADEITGYDRIRLNYLELPVNLAVEPINGFKIYAGPYVAMGLNGMSKWDYTYKMGDDEYTETGETKIVFKFGEVDLDDLEEDEGVLNALDYGVNAGAMVFAGPVFFNVGVTQGMANIMPSLVDVDDLDYDRKDFKTYNTTITASLGLTF